MSNSTTGHRTSAQQTRERPACSWWRSDFKALWVLFAEVLVREGFLEEGERQCCSWVNRVYSRDNKGMVRSGESGRSRGR